jgi:hypothetical protein
MVMKRGKRIAFGVLAVGLAVVLVPGIARCRPASREEEAT